MASRLDEPLAGATLSDAELRGRREIESFFIGEVDRDKLVLAGSAL